MGTSQSTLTVQAIPTPIIPKKKRRNRKKRQSHTKMEDDEYYSSLRKKARQEAESRNDLYELSQVAYLQKEGQKAKELSVQGHIHDDQMKMYNQQAAEYMYTKNNQGRSINEIDLHGLFVAEANQKVEEAIQRCQAGKQDHLVIIVGKGLHSPGQIAKLKPAIIKLVEKYNISCQPDIPNPGCLYVEFGKGKGDLSWLYRITEKVVKGEGCLVM
ncbi:unnamed protein product [Rhizopus stolonifer]